MRTKLLTLNHIVLFVCASMYLGTGWSLVLFSFPISDQLTPDNYYLQFVPQVTAATHFFTYMTMVMMICAAVMIWSEWHTPQRWVPVLVVLGVLGATGLTKWVIFPLNDEMAGHITDAVRLKQVLGEWMNLNRVRVSIWSVQWVCMMYWFFHWSVRGREAK
jgi:hypothetical protein